LENNGKWRKSAKIFHGRSAEHQLGQLLTKSFLAELVLGAPSNCSRIRVYLCSFVVQIKRNA